MSSSQPSCGCDEGPLWRALWAWHMQECKGSKQDTAFRVILEGFGIRALCSTLNSFFSFLLSLSSCICLQTQTCQFAACPLRALVPIPQHHFRAFPVHRTLCALTCPGAAPHWGPSSQHCPHSVPGCGWQCVPSSMAWATRALQLEKTFSEKMWAAVLQQPGNKTPCACISLHLKQIEEIAKAAIPGSKFYVLESCWQCFLSCQHQQLGKCIIPTKAAQGSALWSQGGGKGKVLERGKCKATETWKKKEKYVSKTPFGIDFLNQFSYY